MSDNDATTFPSRKSLVEISMACLVFGQNEFIYWTPLLLNPLISASFIVVVVDDAHRSRSKLLGCVYCYEHKSYGHLT